MTSNRKGDYGFDAPYVLLGFALGASAGIVASLIGLVVGPAWLVGVGIATFAINATCCASFVFTTRIGKHLAWSQLITELALRGDETVVDVGCGRGAVLLLAAEHVARGKAIGVDIWSTTDQSGNAREVTLRNAELEGVASRVELLTADMRAIPLPDGSADLVVSSLAIHNIASATERAKALGEILRILRPGGRFVLVDIFHARDYARELARLGAPGTVRRLGPRFWFGGPYVAATAVLGAKPA